MMNKNKKALNFFNDWNKITTYIRHMERGRDRNEEIRQAKKMLNSIKSCVDLHREMDEELDSAIVDGF